VPHHRRALSGVAWAPVTIGAAGADAEPAGEVLRQVHHAPQRQAGRQAAELPGAVHQPIHRRYEGGLGGHGAARTPGASRSQSAIMLLDGCEGGEPWLTLWLLVMCECPGPSG
jgi:hypothetical protein